MDTFCGLSGISGSEKMSSEDGDETEVQAAVKAMGSSRISRFVFIGLFFQ